MVNYKVSSKQTKQYYKEQLSTLLDEYNKFKAKGLKLDMSRGKPGPEQLDLSVEMLNKLLIHHNYIWGGLDVRNYGGLDGLPQMKDLFSEILGVDSSNIIIGGNSSLNLMFDYISTAMVKGICGNTPWSKQEEVKFLCPCPGYDRHFGICEYFGIKMINVKMNADGPDMDQIEELVKDSSVKGIWCVPKYSNPQGITYSDKVVKRFAALCPAAKDFRIMWDNAYVVHDIFSEEKVLNILDECKKTNHEDLPIIFSSTSKITFPGSGVACIAASDNNVKDILSRMKSQTIGHDKVNQIRHVQMFGNLEGVKEHMKKHSKFLGPRFKVVLDKLEENFGENKIVKWTNPNGGYFISVDVPEGCAKRVATLLSDAGVKITPAGATYPYGIDPDDKNIRIAPSYPPISELETAMEMFCLCVKIAYAEK